MLRRAVLTVLLSVLVAGCGGWYLRGTRQADLGVKRVFVVAPNSTYLRNFFVQQLNYNNITLVASKDQAEAVIELQNEEYDRRVLSVDPDTGKVREIELGLQVEVTVRARDGSLIAAPDTLNWMQDFVFDEESLLGTEEVEQTIRYELAKNAALALMLKLETIDFKNRGADAR